MVVFSIVAFSREFSSCGGSPLMFDLRYKAGKCSTKAENKAPNWSESTGLHCSTTFRGVGEGETAR
jgi:hypothetical protein